MIDVDIELSTVARSFSKAALTYEHQAFMQNTMADRLCLELERFVSARGLSTVKQSLSRVLEIGCGPGNFTKLLLERFSIDELCLNDLSASMLKSNLTKLQELKYHTKLSTLCADALSLSKDHELLAEPFDALVSNATFQWFGALEPTLEFFATLLKPSNFLHPLMAPNLPSASVATLEAHQSTKERLPSSQGQDLSKIALTLASPNIAACKCSKEHVAYTQCKGRRLIAFSSFYAGNFSQIKELTGLSLEYLSREQIIRALKSCAGDYQVQFEEYQQSFASPLELFKNLKSTGVTALGHKPLPPRAFKQLLVDYQERYSDERGVYLTWHPYYVVALI